MASWHTFLLNTGKKSSQLGGNIPSWRIFGFYNLLVTNCFYHNDMLKVLLTYLEFYSGAQGLSYFLSVWNTFFHFYLLYLKKPHLQILISKLVEAIIVVEFSTQTEDRHNLPKNLLSDLSRTWSAIIYPNAPWSLTMQTPQIVHLFPSKKCQCSFL